MSATKLEKKKSQPQRKPRPKPDEKASEASPPGKLARAIRFLPRLQGDPRVPGKYLG